MSDEWIGRYQILGEIGRGGMAVVLLGYDPSTQRKVAIKVLPAQMLHDPVFRERFTREAKTIAALEHSAIVPVYDYGEDNNRPFLVMRNMTGGSLAERIHLGSLSLEETAYIVQ